MNASRVSTTLRQGDEQYVLSHGPITLTFDMERGTLTSIEHDTLTLTVATDQAQLEWLVGGAEHRPPPTGTTTYPGATAVGSDRQLDSIHLVRSGHTHELRVTSRCGTWELYETYTFEINSMRFEWGFDLVNRSDEEVRLRRVTLGLPLGGFEPAEWFIDVPASSIAPDRPFRDLPDGRIAERGPGPMLGLVGLVGDAAHGLASWVLSEETATSLRVSKQDHTVDVRYGLETAARLAPDEGVSFGSIWIEPFDSSWESFLHRFDEWWEVIDIGGPEHIPEWTINATYFEAYIGHTVKDDTGYGPYPTIDDLIEDLPRIRELGFEVLQLMPAQPAPSYVYPASPWGGDAWGGATALRELVQTAHGLGLRVILDIVIHGVLDLETLDRTIASIHEDELLDGESALIAEYVVEHEAAWREELPERHPLVDEHPDWFVSDDEGTIAHRYTRAFDLANPAVQDYVIDRLCSLVREYGIDGFRVDAPAWNSMPNWRTDLAYPAGHSQVGGVELVHRARTALTSVRPDLCLYLEAASPLFRSASEVTYPNDETWLPAVLAEEEISAYGRPLVGGRVRGTDVSTWLSRCELLYPSVTRGRTVHHISSHDTVWWSPLGKKWCTERYGRSLTVAMYAVLSLIEGSFMVFTGDERGVEDELDRFLELRNQLPELAVGACRFGAFSSDEAVFTAVREHGDRRSIVAVNLSDEAVETTLDGSEAFLPNGSPIVIYDALGRTYHRTSEGAVVHRHSPGDLSVAFAAWEPRLFVVRRASDVADIGRDFDAP